MEKGREKEREKGREKSRTPKEERKGKEEQKKTDKEKQKKAKEEEHPGERKRLEFGPSDSKDTAKQETSLAIDIVTPDKAPPSKKTRFADSDEETQESKKSAQSSKSSKTTKSDTPKMALTTQRLKAMTVSTPVRGDGTKTPLRIPPTELQQNRNTTRSSSGTSDTDMEEDDGTIEPLHSLEEVQQALQTLSQRQKHQHESTTKQMQELSQSIIDINYDVESQGRTNAHLIYSKLQTDAKEASMALTIEGFPKEASEDDRKDFASWLLQQAHSKDHAPSISLWNTRGELSNFINITFTSGYHRNTVFQSFLENYTYKKKKLFWYAASTGRESNHEIRVREALSEDARLRGRFVKAAMEAINETHRNEVEFYPSWHENAVREKQSHNYLVWLHFSYATASCEIFVDEPFFEEVANNFETKLSEISKGTRRGKGTGKGKMKTEETRKGSSKGAFAALDFSYDARIPFWCKFIQVHDWKNNMQVRQRQALKEEEKAKETMEQSEG